MDLRSVLRNIALLSILLISIKGYSQQPVEADSVFVSDAIVLGNDTITRAYVSDDGDTLIIANNDTLTFSQFIQWADSLGLIATKYDLDTLKTTISGDDLWYLAANKIQNKDTVPVFISQGTFTGTDLVVSGNTEYNGTYTYVEDYNGEPSYQQVGVGWVYYTDFQTGAWCINTTRVNPFSLIDWLNATRTGTYTLGADTDHPTEQPTVTTTTGFTDVVLEVDGAADIGIVKTERLQIQNTSLAPLNEGIIWEIAESGSTEDTALFNIETSGVTRFSIPIQGAGFATQNYRSLLVGSGGITYADSAVYAEYAGYDPDFLPCNTGLYGADLGVEHNVQVKNNVRIDSALYVGVQVGIGTTSPATDLHIYNSDVGKIRVEGATSGGVNETAANLVLKDETTTDLGIYTLRNDGLILSHYVSASGKFKEVFYSGQDSSILIGSLAIDNIQIGDEDDPTMYIKSTDLGGSKLVGIGTTSPTEALDVNGNIAFDTAMFTNGSMLWDIAVLNDSTIRINDTSLIISGGGGGSGINNYVTGVAFNTSTGVLTLTRSGLGNLTEDLDGRYLLISDTTGISAQVYVNADSIAALRTDINSNAADIASNATDIANNVISIASNLALIQSNDADIASNLTLIQSNATDISSNLTLINSNATDISNNTDSITAHRVDINNNTADIGSNLTLINAKQNYTDTTTYDATRYWVGLQGYLTSYTETDPVWTADKPEYYTSAQVDALPVSTFTNDVPYLTSYTETDPIWTADKPDYYTSTQVDNLPVSTFTNDVGYLTSYTETDPVWISDSATYSAKSWVQALPISTFTNDVPYLISYTETDPIWISDSANYAAKSWVQSQGYLTSYTETDPFYFAAFDSLLRNEDTASLLATQTKVFTAVDTLTTDGITEGTTNLYNQTHTGDVTGATTLTIASNAVGADELNVSGNGTIGYSLTSDGDGSFSWTDVSGGAGSSYWTPSNDTLYPNSGYNHVYAADFVGGSFTGRAGFATLAALGNDAFGTQSYGKLEAGTETAFTITSGEELGYFRGSGSTTNPSVLAGLADIRAYATEDWLNNTSVGTGWRFYSIPSGNVLQQKQMEINGDGDVIITNDVEADTGKFALSYDSLYGAPTYDNYENWRLWYSADNATGRNITSGGHVYVNDGYGVTVTSGTQSNATYTWADINVKADTSEIATQYDLTQVGGSSYWTQNGTDLYYTTGNVGIGTTSPTARMHVNAPAVTGREQILRAGCGENTNINFNIYNATSSSGNFTPAFAGSNNSNTSLALLFTGTTTSSYDSGTTELIRFSAKLNDGDPINGTFTTISTRPLFGFYNQSLPSLILQADLDAIFYGNVGIGTTSPTSGYKLDVNGNLKATSGLFTLTSISGRTITTTGQDLIIDAATDNVQVSADLAVTGNVYLRQGVTHSYNEQTGNYTITTEDYTVVLTNSATGNSTFTLPSSPSSGQHYIITNKSTSHTLKVADSTSTTLITLSATTGFSDPKTIVLEYNGSGWTSLIVQN